MFIDIKSEKFSNDEYKKNYGLEISSFYKIFYLAEGNATFQMSGGGSFCISTGDAVLVSPYEKHNLSGKVSHFCEIFFDRDAVSEQILGEIVKCFDESKKIMFGDRQSVINKIIERLIDESRDEKSYRDVARNSIINRLFVEIIRTAEKNSTSIKCDEQAIMNVVEYIDKNYSRKITVEDMQKVACMGASCFQEKFKKYVGMTPNDYLNKTRISISIKFLCNHSLTTDDIARMVGMKSASYYCSQFKKYMNTSPKQYGKVIDLTLNHFNSRKMIEKKDGGGEK